MYLAEDLIKTDWKEYDSLIQSIYTSLSDYLEKNKLKIDVIVPVLRGGGIPAIGLSFKLKTLRIFPLQYKYLSDGKQNKPKLLLQSKKENLIGFEKKAPVFLVVEGNHATGNITQHIVADLKKEFPDAKIIYVALTKDYFYKDSVKADFLVAGKYTNEMRKISKEECEKLKIPFDKCYIFPWESEEEELTMLNEKPFDYNF